MLYSTLETIPNREIDTVIDIVFGNVVKSKHIGHDIMAALRQLIGGEITSYTALLAESREEALQRLLSSAKEKNADAVIGVRFTTNSISANSCEILAFGTAVKLK
ncbi:Domain of uncharacterised function (DUF74) [Phocoenobacter uteri]|uniref:UPF0145 protein NCTC12872_01755 n=1 Tax=Phocoenobacter uteri TaxID=146806 RepID=A0A379CBP8_9PAST|nr:heavy metal-binding domain-containing protein [Phocoenobacter uteri]MDG6881676.1 hypothetical protein [Phocoenobacter uteri]SUB59711.1 Domain of uncharacterised function (DUF74) [Phocoenobacter uteri]